MVFLVVTFAHGHWLIEDEFPLHASQLADMKLVGNITWAIGLGPKGLNFLSACKSIQREEGSSKGKCGQNIVREQYFGEVISCQVVRWHLC
jgi:hypothetical protein